MDKPLSDMEKMEIIKSEIPLKTFNQLINDLITSGKRYLSKKILQESHHQQVIEDLVIDAILDLIEVIKTKLDNIKGSLKGYYLGICQNKAFKYLKGEKKRRDFNYAVPENYLFMATEPQEQKIISKEIRKLSTQILAKWGQRCLEIFRLSFIKLTQDEIAEALNISNSNVLKVTKMRCKRKLIDLIDDQELGFILD